MEFYTGQTGNDQRLQAIDFGTLDTSAYASGDIFTNGAISIDAARFLGFGGTLERFVLKETTSGTRQKPALRIWVFGSSITPTAQNSPQAFSSTQCDVLVGYFDVAEADWVNTDTGCSIAQVNPNLNYVCQPTSKTLYIVPEIKSAKTYASGSAVKGQVILKRD